MRLGKVEDTGQAEFRRGKRFANLQCRHVRGPGDIVGDVHGASPAQAPWHAIADRDVRLAVAIEIVEETRLQRVPVSGHDACAAIVKARGARVETAEVVLVARPRDPCVAGSAQRQQAQGRRREQFPPGRGGVHKLRDGIGGHHFEDFHCPLSRLRASIFEQRIGVGRSRADVVIQIVAQRIKHIAVERRMLFVWIEPRLVFVRLIVNTLGGIFGGIEEPGSGAAGENQFSTVRRPRCQIVHGIVRPGDPGIGIGVKPDDRENVVRLQRVGVHWNDGAKTCGAIVSPFVPGPVVERLLKIDETVLSSWITVAEALHGGSNDRRFIYPKVLQSP